MYPHALFASLFHRLSVRNHTIFWELLSVLTYLITSYSIPNTLQASLNIQVLLLYCLWGLKDPNVRQRTKALGSIPLTYGMERMEGEDGTEWELAKLELQGSRTEPTVEVEAR